MGLAIKIIALISILGGALFASFKLWTLFLTRLMEEDQDQEFNH